MKPLRIDPSRELVACVGGPLTGQWFYADEWQRRREAAQHTKTPHTPEAAGPALHYRDSGQDRWHTDGRQQLKARALTWAGPHIQTQRRITDDDAEGP
jgi:hypothetical protein